MYILNMMFIKGDDCTRSKEFLLVVISTPKSGTA